MSVRHGGDVCMGKWVGKCVMGGRWVIVHVGRGRWVGDCACGEREVGG